MAEACGHYIGQQGTIAIYCSKPKHAGHDKCFSHDEKLIAGRANAAAELKRKAAAYDRLMENLAEQERDNPGVPLATWQIIQVLEGKDV